MSLNQTIIAEPIFYLVAVPAVILTGIGKGGFGAGLGIVAVPAMALIVPPLQAAGIMLPILCVMDIFGVWAYRRHWDRQLIWTMLPAAAVGIAIGAILAGVVEEAHFRLIIGVIAVAFALDHWLAGRARAEAQRPNRVKGAFWSGISGFTSFVGHAGGPPVSVYLLPLKLDKTIYVGTTAIFFATVNYIKLAPYAWLGQLDATNLATAAVLFPLAPLGIWLGIWMHRRVSSELFYRLCYIFVFAIGCKLLWDGVGALWI